MSVSAAIEEIRKVYEGQRLSKQRLELVLFLIDWTHCVKTGTSVAGAEWNSLLGMMSTPQLAPQYRNSLNHEGSRTVLDEKVAQFCARVASVTLGLDFDQLVRAVAQTYPMSSTERYFVLDLPKLAKSFKQNERSQQSDSSPGL